LQSGITRNFAKAKRRGDLEIIRAEIATAPSELRNDNKKDFFSDLKFTYLSIITYIISIFIYFAIN